MIRIQQILYKIASNIAVGFLLIGLYGIGYPNGAALSAVLYGLLSIGGQALSGAPTANKGEEGSGLS